MLSESISSLINKGAKLKSPASQHFMFWGALETQNDAYAFTALIIDDKKPPKALSYQVHYFDQDQKTGKIYMVYNKTDYIQITTISINELLAYRKQLVQLYFHLTKELLPQKAKLQDWPIQDDHCFQRILLDNLFNGVWYDFLPQKKPAYQQCSNFQLGRMVYDALHLYFGNQEMITQWNQKSLGFRNI
ncbi:MAG: hypothetical protein AAFO07_04685 [Bacteroidota bacterium]